MPIAVNVNGEIVAPERARVSVFDHGFLYGDSVYETLRSSRGRCFLADQHLARLERSAAGIALALPLPPKELAAEIDRTVAAAGNEASAVRVMVTRGEGPIGLDPRLCPRATLVIVARPFEPLPAAAYERGVTVVLARTARNSRRSLDPQIKSGNFLNNILGAQEALRTGALEALMLNLDGNLAEATQSNVFLVRDGVVVTPDPAAGLLRGITRELLLRLLPAAGLPVEERDVFVSEIYDADELFLTSTLKGVVPVARVGTRGLAAGAPGPVTRRAMSLYEAEWGRFASGG